MGWWASLFGSSAAAAAPTRSARAVRSDQTTGRSPANHNAVDARWLEHAPQFAPFAQALGLEFALPSTLTPAQEEQVLQLSAAVVNAATHDESGPTSLPTAALRTLNLVARTDVEVSELAGAIHQDPALTAAVLRMANSASMSAAAGEIHTVRDAVTRLGLVESGRVAGAVAAKTLFSPRLKSAHAVYAPQFAELHAAASTVAGGAAHLAMERGAGRSDLAYLGGMLHAVGKSLGLAALAALVLENRAPRELDPNVLQHIIEARQVELGVHAHERWGLPQYLTTLCASQHDAEVPKGTAQAELHLVRVVSGLVGLRTRPQSLQRIAELVQSLSVLGITPLQARALDAGLRARSAQVRQVLG